MKRLPKSYANGSLSHGTMLEEDLLPCFLGFLRSVAKRCQITTQVHDIESELLTSYLGHDAELREVLLNETIWDLLNEIAPTGSYFGSHPGDGSDYGSGQEE